MEQPEIRYARSGEVNIAYQVTGDGPFDLVLVPGFISHLELDWKEPRHARFLERLGSFARLIRFDKRGTGLSDRPSALGGIETRMDDVRAVIDAVGCERAALFAFWEGGPMAAVFAATYPERTSALVLFGTFARRIRSEDYPWHLTRDELVAAVEHVVEVWGTEETTGLASFSPGADAALRRWWIARDRAGATPGAIRHLITSNIDIDVRPALPSIQAPCPPPRGARRRGRVHRRPDSGRPARHDSGPSVPALACPGRHRRSRAVPDGCAADAARGASPRHDPRHRPRRLDRAGARAWRPRLGRAARAASHGGADRTRALSRRGN